MTSFGAVEVEPELMQVEAAVVPPDIETELATICRQPPEKQVDIGAARHGEGGVRNIERSRHRRAQTAGHQDARRIGLRTDKQKEGIGSAGRGAHVHIAEAGGEAQAMPEQVPLLGVVDAL